MTPELENCSRIINQQLLDQIKKIFFASTAMGAGVGGLQALHTELKPKTRPQSAYQPVVIDIPAKQAGEEVQVNPALGPNMGLFNSDTASDWMHHKLTIPLATLAAGGGLYGGWKLVDYLTRKGRNQELQTEVGKARKDYEQALASQFKQGSALNQELDELYGLWEKSGYDLENVMIGLGLTGMGGLGIGSALITRNLMRKRQMANRARRAYETHARTVQQMSGEPVFARAVAPTQPLKITPHGSDAEPDDDLEEAAKAAAAPLAAGGNKLGSPAMPASPAPAMPKPAAPAMTTPQSVVSAPKPAAPGPTSGWPGLRGEQPTPQATPQVAPQAPTAGWPGLRGEQATPRPAAPQPAMGGPAAARPALPPPVTRFDSTRPFQRPQPAFDAGTYRQFLQIPAEMRNKYFERYNTGRTDRSMSQAVEDYRRYQAQQPTGQAGAERQPPGAEDPALAQARALGRQDYFGSAQGIRQTNQLANVQGQLTDLQKIRARQQATGQNFDRILNKARGPGGAPAGTLTPGPGAATLTNSQKAEQGLAAKGYTKNEQGQWVPPADRRPTATYERLPVPQLTPQQVRGLPPNRNRFLSNKRYQAMVAQNMAGPRKFQRVPRGDQPGAGATPPAGAPAAAPQDQGPIEL